MAKGLMGLICCFVLTVVIFTESVAAVNYTVGGTVGWTNTLPNSTYYSDTRDENKDFKIGDILIFNWNESHNVAEVLTEAEYEQCLKPSAKLLSDKSPFVYNITKTGDHYFICTVGSHCHFGQKLKIDVDNSTTPSTPATPSTNNTGSSSPSFAPFGTLSTAVCALVLYFFM